MIIEHLCADTFGSHIGKYRKRLKITQNKHTLSQAPLLHLQSVMITGRGVSISADAIQACCERGIPILFLTDHGNPYASLHASGLTGTVITRREQLLAYYDVRGTHIAVAIARAKICNQRATLKYLAKNRRGTQSEIVDMLNGATLTLTDSIANLESLSMDVCLDHIRNSIMGIEGHAARAYWEAVAQIMPSDYGWKGRAGRGALDPINSLLNYGYGILYSRIEQAVILAGLDPYAGFLHTDRSGKPSLVLDVIEEFRQIAVDRLVFGLVARHFKIQQQPDGRLCDDTRQAYAQKVLDHLDSTTRYMGKRYALRYIMQNQARRLSAYLRGKSTHYEPFLATW